MSKGAGPGHLRRAVAALLTGRSYWHYLYLDIIVLSDTELIFRSLCQVC